MGETGVTEELQKAEETTREGQGSEGAAKEGSDPRHFRRRGLSQVCPTPCSTHQGSARRGEMHQFSQVRGLSLQPDLQVTPKRAPSDEEQQGHQERCHHGWAPTSVHIPGVRVPCSTPKSFTCKSHFLTHLPAQQRLKLVSAPTSPDETTSHPPDSRPSFPWAKPVLGPPWLPVPDIVDTES